jgi:hypothetical protein
MKESNVDFRTECEMRTIEIVDVLLGQILNREENDSPSSRVDQWNILDRFLERNAVYVHRERSRKHHHGHLNETIE